MKIGLANCIAITVTGVILAGCMTERDRKKCADYGFKPGTDAMAQCMQNEDLARRGGGPTVCNRFGATVVCN
ncbi:hypothetical protein [Mesorhizobium sp.]|uniref:hypothetical protein n=1 Tax=Mesorhizobium sp. TaxID=1871066 RepID=UPI000FE7E3FF|nr:hypothetical protein [Mesorhizobium sp.]RWA80840.1 MAG: hypothetical protein EOQ30_21540 [Mesorhizobium sp.]